MGFKVASRVRGLSDEAFSGGLVRTVPLGAGPAALAGRLPLPLLRPSIAINATGEEADIAHGGHDLPRDQAAADTLVSPDRDGEERHLVGGTRSSRAWAVKHKIMAVMARREGETALTGRVEMDDAYLGGVRSGGKRGRGAAGKTPFAAAVSTSPEGRPPS